MTEIITSKTIVTEDDFTDAHDYMLDHTQNEDEILLERWDGVRNEWVRKDMYNRPYIDRHNDEDSKLQSVLNACGTVKYRLVYEMPEKAKTVSLPEETSISMSSENTPCENSTTIIATFEEHEIRTILDVMTSLREVSQRAAEHTKDRAQRVEVTKVTLSIEGEELPYAIELSEFNEHAYALVERKG